ncbi:MAG: alanine racemase, partial [Patescibacteria group bacterium]
MKNSVLFRKPYQTLNLVKINKSTLLSNFAFFQKQNPQAKICPVLKSNAYGYGLKLIGKFVDEEIKPEFICVDSLYEAYELEKTKITTPLLILGYTFPENFKHRNLNFRLPVFDGETLKILNKYQPGIKVHIKVDTGMNRLGIKENQVDGFVETLKQYPEIRVEGIYSHLADADNEDEAFSLKQIETFKRIIKKFEAAGFNFKYKHLCATAGSLKFKDPEFNLIRLGFGFYQVPNPALKLISHIIDIKEVEKGETVSYNCTFKAKQKMKIAALPIGYYDGIDRRLSNAGSVSVRGISCPIVGRVCMNITTIDVTKVKDVKIGQEVEIDIINQAELVHKSPYEALVN